MKESTKDKRCVTMVFIVESPQNGRVRKEILEEIQESGYKDLIYEFWGEGADIFSGSIDTVKQSRYTSVRVTYTVYWCYLLQGVA